MHFTKTAAALGLSVAARSALAIDLNLSNTDSIRAAAKTIADNIITRYTNGSRVPGLFGPPYYFWESGLTWDSLINYQYLTGDTSYNDLIGEALMHQIGPNSDFMPPNQTKTEGNDDQAYWALAAMTAAEWGFPEPRNSSSASGSNWAQLAQNVFDEQAARWDNGTCNGGLRWQIFAFNNGYDYKNSMSTGAFFQLASRLAHYTGNQTYTEWANAAYQWSFDVGLIANRSDTENVASVYDGTDIAGNCTTVNHIQWTANIGQYIAGLAYLANTSRSLLSMDYVSLVSRANLTFASLPNAAANGTLTETACAPNGNCNVDQLAFRAVLARALAQVQTLTQDTRLYEAENVTTPNGQTHPAANYSEPEWTIHERISFILETSARGAATQCSGGDDGTTCGNSWGNSTFDGSYGLGQDLSALNIMLANLPAGSPANSSVTRPARAPASNGTTAVGGGNSTSGGAPPQATASGASGIPASSFALLAGIAFAIAFCV